MANVNCPYCGALAVQVTGREVYPHRPDLYSKTFYVCTPCDARVGCHPGTNNPLGRLANAELRKAKSAAHRAFDPLWKASKLSRAKAYAELARALGIPPKDCHIGMFDLDLCERTIQACKSLGRHWPTP